MKKKFYKEPTIQVVQLQQTGMLMTSGPVDTSMPGIFEEETLAPQQQFPGELLVPEFQLPE